jgi:hypothetical protein
MLRMLKLELLGTYQCMQTETLQGNQQQEKAPAVLALALLGMALELAQVPGQVQVVGCRAVALVPEQPGQ